VSVPGQRRQRLEGGPDRRVPAPRYQRRAAPGDPQRRRRARRMRPPGDYRTVLPGFPAGHAEFHGGPRPFRARRPRLSALQVRRCLPARRPAQREAAPGGWAGEPCPCLHV